MVALGAHLALLVVSLGTGRRGVRARAGGTGMKVHRGSHVATGGVGSERVELHPQQLCLAPEPAVGLLQLVDGVRVGVRVAVDRCRRRGRHGVGVQAGGVDDGLEALDACLELAKMAQLRELQLRQVRTFSM
jgi:hypothetical protein